MFCLNDNYSVCIYMRKNCCVNVVSTQPETQAAMWHESITEPVTQSMEIQTLPLFLPVDNRLLKWNDGSHEYRRSRASSRSPGGSESQSPLSQPNFLCPPSLAHSASFCPAWGNQATAWTDARLKSRYPWDPAIPHQFAFQQWGCGYTGHILHKLLVCHQSKPLISRLLAFHRYSTWSVTLSLAFQTDVTERCQKCVCGSDMNGCDLFTDETGFVFQWETGFVFRCQSCHFLPGDQCLRHCLHRDMSHDLTFRQKQVPARDPLEPVFAVPWDMRRSQTPTANMQQGILYH